jgi:2-polyprenyl-3-methyl-5-hydroxy-6-metoxy-1,4-benzoquinol methylase
MQNGAELMNAPYFDKYDRKHAYHWGDYFGGLWRMNAYTRARYNLVLECARAANLPANAHILEVGCGDGALLGVLFSELGVAVYGVDTSEIGLALAREMFADRKLVGDFRYTTGYDTGFPEASFDLIVCSDVIEHVDNPNAMLVEIRRLLIPGGRLIITTPIKFLEKPVDPMHVQEWFVNDFKILCREVFGEPIESYSSHPLFWYELVSSSNPWVVRAGRLMTNLLTRLGQNPFMERRGTWRCYTTQTLVLQKAGRDYKADHQ